MPRYHPWSHLLRRHPEVHVECHTPIPDDHLGSWRPSGIFLHPKCSQAERRCTLAHELVHLDRGEPPCDRRGRGREELRVDDVAARRLITLDALVDAIRWGQGKPDPGELWVDLPMLLHRVRSLQQWERDYIDAQLGGWAA